MDGSRRSAGCDAQAGQHGPRLPEGLQPGGEVELTLAYKPSSGLTTRYKLSVPTRYDGNVSWPLLVGFHGWGGSGNHSLDAFPSALGEPHKGAVRSLLPRERTAGR